MAMKKSEKRDQLLILEILGLKEFCEIALLACQEVHTIVTDKLMELIKEFPHILDQDAKDILITYEEVKKVLYALSRLNAPNQALTWTPAWVLANKMHFLKNPMFHTSFFKEKDKRAMDLLLEGNNNLVGLNGEIQKELLQMYLCCLLEGMSWTCLPKMEDHGQSKI